jgi:putative cardiolipin synthase
MPTVKPHPTEASAVNWRRACFILAGILLSACAAAPQVANKSVSHFNDRAAVESPLVALATSHAGSGVTLLADPADALQSRLHLAAMAQSTLDMQYYLWQGDDSGLALTREVLLAADRGVRVRILLDDIYHSGRDSAYQTLDTHPNVEVRLFNPMGNRGATNSRTMRLENRPSITGCTIKFFSWMA